METKTVKGRMLDKPARRECKNMLSMAEIITNVNAILNPGQEPVNWFAPAGDAVAAVHVKDGVYRSDLSNETVLYGGSVSDKECRDIKVVAYKGNEGGIYAEGKGTDVTVERAYISLEGEGCGIGGPASGAAAKYGASLTLKDVVINTTGRTKYATAAEENSVLKVYDSVIWSHGIPYGDEYERPKALMSSPPCPPSPRRALYTWRQMTVILSAPRMGTARMRIRAATTCFETAILIWPVWRQSWQETAPWNLRTALRNAAPILP